MWSLKQGLRFYKKHLPSGYDASKGVLSLFPSGYKGSISPLKHYVFFTYARLATQFNFGPQDDYFGSAGNLYLLTDATGRWFFSWSWWPISTSASYLRQAGFVFQYSNDGTARGFVDMRHPAPNTKCCNSGTDKWIADHWPQVFAGRAHISLQEGSTIDESQVWTTSGFAQSKFSALSGSTSNCISSTSGSALFPYPMIPTRLLSSVGILLSSSMVTAGQLLAKGLSKLPATFTRNGLTFQVTPAGMKATDSGNLEISFSSADKKSTGKFTWALPALTSKLTANLAVSTSKDSGTLNYTYVSNAPASNLGKLDYTVSLVGAGKNTSSVTQTVVDGLVTAQTSSTTVGGTTRKTTFTIESDGTLELSDPSAAPTIGVAASSAQKLQLSIYMNSAVVGLINELLTSVAGGSSETLFVQDSPIGSLNTTISTQTAPDGTIQSYTVTESSQPSAEINFVGAMTIDATTGLAAATANIQISEDGTSYSANWTYSTSPQGTTETESMKSDDGLGNVNTTSSTSENGTVTNQSSTASDAWGNTSTATVTFDPTTGNFTLQITTADAQGNGTTDTINGDVSGNVTSETTGTTGDMGSGTPAGDGSTVGSDGSGNDDGGDGGDGSGSTGGDDG